MFSSAKWIWPDLDVSENRRGHFFFDAQLDTVPEKAILHIGCETKYWLFVNGSLAVFDGGLFRESLPGCGYYDSVDITKFLHIGRNTIAIHVWYFGNGGRNNTAIQGAGLIAQCDELGLFTGADTLGYVDDAYYLTTFEKSWLYGGGHTAYDANVRPFSLCPNREKAEKCLVVGSYGDAPWGQLVARPVPLLFFTERIPCPYTLRDGKYIVALPYAMHFSPYMKVNAKGGEKIIIHSDRYITNGGPGDHNSRYFGHRAEYICHEGAQEFEMLDWIFGEESIYTIPEGVEILELGYRESGYDTKVTTEFHCDQPEVNILFQKCVRTLLVCMRENYMDCPDRERGQWIGDVSVQTPQVAYLLDNNGLLLLRKAICDFINLRKGDRLVGNVPGDNWSELPSQSLNAISEHGMIATYYQATGDRSVLELAFEPAVKYLMLWETDEDGVILPRSGNWEWYDHLYNHDSPILSICWYYSALRFAKTMAGILDRHEYDSFIQTRMSAIEAVFEDRYWNPGYSCYLSGNYVDDRANAMAVLSGLCPKEKYPLIAYILMSVFNSTTYMENYVLLALCEMGYKEDAYRRMMSRYKPLIESPNSTLWEDFFHLGTRNHAWSGGPATVLLRYFVGIQSDLSIADTDIAPLNHLKCRFIDRNGQTITIEKNRKS